MDTLKFDSRRPVVVAEHGAVACADPRAVLMGLGMFLKGQCSSNNSHKNTGKFCANQAEYINYPYIEVNGLNGETYNCVNNYCANYPECAN